MTSAHSEPAPLPTYTRITHNGRPYVALGTYTHDEMVRAIERRG